LSNITFCGTLYFMSFSGIRTEAPHSEAVAIQHADMQQRHHRRMEIMLGGLMRVDTLVGLAPMNGSIVPYATHDASLQSRRRIQADETKIVRPVDLVFAKLDGKYVHSSESPDLPNTQLGDLLGHNVAPVKRQ
jgi:hypothetical protein